MRDNRNYGFLTQPQFENIVKGVYPNAIFEYETDPYYDPYASVYPNGNNDEDELEDEEILNILSNALKLKVESFYPFREPYDFEINLRVFSYEHIVDDYFSFIPCY